MEEEMNIEKAKTIAENVAYYHRSAGKAVSEGHKEILAFAKSYHQSQLQALKEEVEKESHIPFSVQWWLNMYRVSLSHAWVLFKDKGRSRQERTDLYHRYNELATWINERIVKKILNLITNLEDNGH